VSHFALAPDGKVVSAGYDGSVQVWDLTRGRAEVAFRPKTGSIFTALSADGKLLAGVDWQQTDVAIHERDTGRLVRTIAIGKSLRGVSFAPQGRLLVVGEGIPAREFRLWDADTGREVRRLPDGMFGHPVFSPDGRSLATLGEKAVRILEFPSGKELFSFVEEGTYELVFSPDGRTLACGGRKTIALWEMATQKRRGRIELKGPDCAAVRFSADGRWLAWGENEDIQLYDLLRNRPLHTFRGHEGNVTDLRFTRDGRTLISASGDSTLLVWDLQRLRNE
jgi:WD40 repeat protein